MARFEQSVVDHFSLVVIVVMLATRMGKGVILDVKTDSSASEALFLQRQRKGYLACYCRKVSRENPSIWGSGPKERMPLDSKLGATVSGWDFYPSLP